MMGETERDVGLKSQSDSTSIPSLAVNYTDISCILSPLH